MEGGAGNKEVVLASNKTGEGEVRGCPGENLDTLEPLGCEVIVHSGRIGGKYLVLSGTKACERRGIM